MKIFICSIAAFLLLCTLVTLNAVTVCNYTDALIAETNNLPAEPDRVSTDRLIDLWFEYDKVLNISISHSITDQIELALYELKNASDPSIYGAKRDTLLVYLRDMRSTAGLSWERII